jgi:hypothetical protein
MPLVSAFLWFLTIYLGTLYLKSGTEWWWKRPTNALGTGTQLEMIRVVGYMSSFSVCSIEVSLSIFWHCPK